MTDVGVAVVGGGLAGLFTAGALEAAGWDDLVVLDSAPHPGGVARTITRDGYSLEPAVGTLSLPHPHLSAVLAWTGVGMAPTPRSASSRLVYTGGRCVAVRPSPRFLLAPVLPAGAKLRALTEPMVRAGATVDDESLQAFLVRRFGKRAGSLLAWLFASGVHAGDPARLSARAAFPALPALEDAAGSVIRGGLARWRERPAGARAGQPHVPLGGMTAVAEGAADRLGDRFLPGFEVGSVAHDGGHWLIEGPETISAAQVVLACPPAAAAALIGGRLAGLLGEGRSAPVAVVWLGGAAESLPLPTAFGVLAGPDAGLTGLGFLFESSYAPDRAPPDRSLVKVIAGGATAPEVAGWDDDLLVRRVGEDLARVLGTDVEASFVEVVRHVPGIPQYEVGHRAWLGEVEAAAGELPGLHLTGWGYRGVGAAHLATDAARIAERITGGPRR